MFVDVVKRDSRPLNNRNNIAMVYVAVPDGRLFKKVEGFYEVIENTSRSVVAACNVFNECENELLPGETVPDVTQKYFEMYLKTPCRKARSPDPIQRLGKCLLVVFLSNI